MTKSELIEAVANKLKLPKGKAELIVNCVFDSMEATLKRGERIEIRGFGSFEIRHYKAYEGRNPRTGEPVHVPPNRFESLARVADPDTFYHWAHAAAYLRGSPLDTAFPWARFSAIGEAAFYLLRDSFVDAASFAAPMVFCNWSSHPTYYQILVNNPKLMMKKGKRNG